MDKATIKITCQTPTPGKKSKDILKWKYDIIAKTILELLPESGDGLIFKELPMMIAKKIDTDTKNKIGSIPWYTTTVKLDLECKDKILRVAGSKPQRLIKKRLYNSVSSKI